jgi:UPF0755 protein
MKKLIIVVSLLIIVFLGGFLLWENGLSPANSANKEFFVFTIEKPGLKDIASRLAEAGIIKDKIIFFLYTRLFRYENKIQAGNFSLSPSMTGREVALSLTHGSFDIKVLITEGKRATEIAEALKEKISTYDQSWILELFSNEGYLFPETYSISKDASIENIIKQMRDTFDQNFAKIDTTNSKLTKSQIVILASIIEREAITNEEKPIIAGILVNRLNAGIPLQVDATIQYAKGKNLSNGKWWEPVTIEEYISVISDYNTYLHAGLPPGPISNPGLGALRAAAAPTDTDYLFYLHDKNGQIHYAKTASEHGANIEKYL